MFIESTSPIRKRGAFAPMLNDRETTFELYERISPVAILYGTRRRYVTEHNHSRRLIRELHRLGREGIEVEAMISEHGALSRESLRALNAYLCHYLGRRSWNQVRVDGMHRFAWYGIQRACALRWVR